MVVTREVCVDASIVLYRANIRISCWKSKKYQDYISMTRYCDHPVCRRARYKITIRRPRRAVSFTEHSSSYSNESVYLINYLARTPRKEKQQTAGERINNDGGQIERGWERERLTKGPTSKTYTNWCIYLLFSLLSRFWLYYYYYILLSSPAPLESCRNERFFFFCNKTIRLFG